MKKYQWTLLMMLLASMSFSQVTFPEKGYVFDDSVIPRIDIAIDGDSLFNLLAPWNLESNHEYPVDFVFTKNGSSDTLSNVGFRLRGNTSRNAAKKSYKVSFNSFKKGRNFHGLEKMNLNGEHNDPSITRAKLCWDLYRQAGIPGSRSNHVLLYINDEFFGIYLHVEHVDEEFIEKRFTNDEGNLYKCLWPADLHYRGADPNLYKVPENFGRQAYELKTNLDVNDYSDIAQFIDILNNYSGDEFICAIEEVFDVDNYLRAMVMDILTSNWDGPIANKNNFYLYSDPCTEKIHYIPYDLDNTWGIDWFGVDWPQTQIYSWSDISGEYRPIFESFMNIPAYRNKFSRYMDEFLSNFFNRTHLDPILDNFRATLFPHRQSDMFAELDYGFTSNDFAESFTDFSQDHVPYGLKSYITARSESALFQLITLDTEPTLLEQEVDWSETKIDFNFLVQAHGTENMEVVLHYMVNQGTETTVTLSDMGNLSFPFSYNVVDLGVIDYYITITSSNGLQRRYPFCDYYQEQLGFKPVPKLIINEFMASNQSGYVDEGGAFTDWIEIYNAGDSAVPLWDKYLTDDPDNPNKWELPHMVLNSDDYIVIYADNDPEEGPRHANFSLKKEGEFIGLFDDKSNRYAVMDTFTYGPQTTDIAMARIPNGTGPFVTATMNTPGGNNEEVLDTDNLAMLQEWTIYPNPASYTIQINDFYGDITISDYNGQVLLRAHMDQVLDVSDLPSGVYIVGLRNGTHKEYHKLIKL